MDKSQIDVMPDTEDPDLVDPRSIFLSQAASSSAQPEYRTQFLGLTAQSQHMLAMMWNIMLK